MLYKKYKVRLQIILGVRRVYNQIKSIGIELTDRCNLICKHCSTEATPFKSTFLDLNTIKRILHTAKEFNAEYLSLSGGEPLLHPQIEEILITANELQYETCIYSSGVMNNKQPLDNDQIKMIKEYADKIIFSLFSDSADIHDRITDVNGSFNITLQSIKSALSFNLETEVHTVPMSINYKRIPAMLKLLEGMGINEISLLRLVPHGRYSDNDGLRMTRQQEIKMKESIKKVEKTSGINRIRKGAPYKCLFLNEASSCSAGENKILISPNGDVHPCEAFKSDPNVSNIKEQTLYHIWWNDKQLNALRDLDLKQINNCNNCHKLDLCQAGCPGQRWLTYNDIATGPEPGCQILSNL